MNKKLLIYTLAAGMAIGSISMGIPAVQAAVKQEVGPGVKNEAQKPLESLLVWGPVKRVDKEYNRIVLDNQSQNSMSGEMILNLSAEQTRVLDAVEGHGVSLDDLTEGEVIYAYIGPAMTMSLPPQTTASLVLCKIPADFRVPEQVKVSSMEKQEDGSFVLKGTNETEYAVPADCVIRPYLTRNMVYLDAVTEGDTCLVWQGSDNQVNKIILFAN